MKFRHFATVLTVGIGTVATLILLGLLGSLSAAAAHEPILSLSSTVQKPTTSLPSDATPLHYVATTGVDGSDCSTAASACRTIQYAVDQAGAGDVIKVAQGTYTDIHVRDSVTQVVYISKTLTVRGGYTTTNWMVSDPAANPTTLDAQRQGRVIYITGNISPTIEGLRITGGSAAGLGGGVSGRDAGGGVYIVTATVTISHNRVFSNIALANSYGGGLYLFHSDATLVENTITVNTATFGGGLYFRNSAGPLLIDNVVSHNCGETHAGGLYFRYSPSPTLILNTISSNFAPSPAGYYGGMRFDHSHNAKLIKNTVSGNRAADFCGGACFDASDNALLIGNTFIGNSAGTPGFPSSALGGGLRFVSSNGANLISNTVTNNQAFGNGGGLYLERSDITLTNNVIADNQLKSTTSFTGNGSGLYISGSSPQLLHTTVARNGGGASGIYVTDVYGSFSAVAMTNTILVSHSVGITVTTGNTVTLNGVLWYSNITNYGGLGTITITTEYAGDPAFDADGYHLTAASAAIDRGVDAGVDHDIDGEPRSLDGNLDSMVIADMGADEFAPNASLTITKQANPDPVQAWSPLIYTIRITNTGNVTLNATVTDILPYWVTPSSVLTWTEVTLAPDSVWSEQFVVTPRPCYSGTLSNSVQVTTLEGATGDYTETSSVVFTGHCVYLPIALKNWTLADNKR